MADTANYQQPQQIQSQPQYIFTHATSVPSTRPSKPISKWWFISLLILSAIFFVIGGSLLGSVSSNSMGYYSSSYGQSSYFNYLYGSFACFALAGVCKLVAWILVTVYCVQRRKYLSASSALPTSSQPGYVMAMAPSPNNPMQQPPNYGIPAAAASFMNEPPPTIGTFCGRCGASVTTAFCTQCGTATSGTLPK